MRFVTIISWMLCAGSHFSFAQHDRYELIPADTIKMLLTAKAPYSTRHLQYVKRGNTQLLLYYNDAVNTIEEYHFKTRKFVNGIPVNTKIDGFCYLNDDSIYVIPKWSSQLLLINRFGEIKGKVDLSNPKEAFFLESSFRNPIVKHGNILMITRTPKLERAQDIPAVAHEVQVAASLKENNYSTLGAFPEEYLKGKWWHFVGFEISKTMNEKGKMIVSYPMSHNIRIHDLDANADTAVNMESKYLRDYTFPPFDDTKRGDSEYKRGYVATLGRYDQILYDRYRNLYYRVALHAQELLNENGALNSGSDVSWSVIVADSNFNIICEHQFEKRMFEFFNIFVSEDGLMVSNNHTLNPDFDPDMLSFTLFTIRKKE